MSTNYWVSMHEDISKESKEALNEYLLSLKLAKKAEATITKYRRIIERFLTECTTAIGSLTSVHVLEWFNDFSNGKKATTIELHLSSLMSFFEFCFEEEWMDQKVMKSRWRPRITETLPKYLTEEEYAKVKRTAEELPVRDRAVILFLFTSGCRRGELCNLLIEDVDLKQRTAVVVGKGDKMRTVHFSIECAIALSDYLATRSDEETGPLFMNKFGQALGPSGVFKLIKKLGEKAGLTQSLHPHVCRHTFATNMLARGASLGFIAVELGHSDMNTTRIYARIPMEDMKNIYHNKQG